MGKRLECKNFGTRCDYSVCAATEQHAIHGIGEHIQAAHAMRRFSKEFYQEALSTIREDSCEQGMLKYELLCEASPGVCLC
jgi:predicted small metal-binding protein